MSVKGQKNLRETKMYYSPDNDHRGISANGMPSMVLQRNDRQISLPADPRRERRWRQRRKGRKGLVIQLNDSDLVPALANNPTNFRLIAAQGDPNRDGDHFGDADD
jgi:hypothetical protein